MALEQLHPRPYQMTTIEEIWTYIDSGEPFTVFLSDGRRFLVKDHHWISSHPSRKSSSIRVFRPETDLSGA
jgi:hypothetical protein